MLSVYEKSEPMVHTGLYAKGSSEEVDEAITLHPKLEEFFSRSVYETIDDSFALLSELLGCGKHDSAQ